MRAESSKNRLTKLSNKCDTMTVSHTSELVETCIPYLQTRLSNATFSAMLFLVSGVENVARFWIDSEGRIKLFGLRHILAKTVNICLA
jgi:hypothetical protein